MKRDVRLRALSRDHHHALVLARFIGAICARGGMDVEAVLLVKERFTAEIAPHFAIEEGLLEALAGKLLAEHVRFEERELYPACEAKLSAVDLDRVALAHTQAEEVPA